MTGVRARLQFRRCCARRTAKRYELRTVTSYYRARYYDAALGRFLNEDPLRFKANTVNFYEYAYDNPMIFTDPSGMQQTVPTTPVGPVMPPPAPPTGPVGPVIGGAGAGAVAGTGAGAGAATGTAAAGGGLGSTLAVGGLVTLDLGLAAWDGYQVYRLGIAYGWWGPGSHPPKCDSGRLSKCVPLGYDRQLRGCRYVCDDGTVWFEMGACKGWLYKPWGDGFPKYPPIPTPKP